MFQTTRWSLVLATRADRASARLALEELFRIYRSPILAYVRRHTASAAEAEDLTQAFLLKFIESQALDRADPTRGRFRNYVLTALQRFLGHACSYAAAQKRGGGRIATSLPAEAIDALPADPDESPERVFEREWAWTVLRRALARLEAEMDESGDRARYDVLRDCLLESPDHDQHGRLAETLGLKRNTVAVLVHRLRLRLRELVRLELAETLAEVGDLEDEMATLRSALRG